MLCKMSNASFHKSKKIKALIESASCTVIFFPTYWPDLNPIEKFWANMKRWIKQKIHFFQGVCSAITSFFELLQFNCFYCSLFLYQLKTPQGFPYYRCTKTDRLFDLC